MWKWENMKIKSHYGKFIIRLTFFMGMAKNYNMYIGRSIMIEWYGLYGVTTEQVDSIFNFLPLIFSLL